MQEVHCTYQWSTGDLKHLEIDGIINMTNIDSPLVLKMSTDSEFSYALLAK